MQPVILGVDHPIFNLKISMHRLFKLPPPRNWPKQPIEDASVEALKREMAISCNEKCLQCTGWQKILKVRRKLLIVDPCKLTQSMQAVSG